MKQSATPNEVELIQADRKVSLSSNGATNMNLMPHPQACEWLTPDHQAVLNTLARWIGEEVDSLDWHAARTPMATEEEEAGK